MRNRILLLMSLILSCTLAYAGQNPEVLWQSGNDCYKRKAFDSAVFYFEQIAAQKADAIIAFLGQDKNKSLRSLAGIPLLLQIMV